MKCELLQLMECGPTAPEDPEQQITEGEKRFWKAGAVIDNPEAWRLVHGGFAKAADEECQAVADAFAARTEIPAGKQREVHNRIMQEQEDFRAELEAEEAEDEDSLI